jgi:MoxR-like ATPase
MRTEVEAMVTIHRTDLAYANGQKTGLPKGLVGGMKLNTRQMPVCAAGRFQGSGHGDVELSYSMARGCTRLLDGEIANVELIGTASDTDPSGVHMILKNGTSHAWVVLDKSPSGSGNTLKLCGMPFSSQLVNYSAGIAVGLFMLLHKNTFTDFASAVEKAVDEWRGQDPKQKAQALALMADELTYRVEEMIEARDPLGVESVVMDREQPTGFETVFTGGQELKEALTNSQSFNMFFPGAKSASATSSTSQPQNGFSFVGDLPLKLTDCVLRGKHVLLTGPTATGKTLCVEEVCLQIGAPLTIIRGSEGLEDRDLIGATTLASETSPTGEMATRTVFTYGPLPEAMLLGKRQHELHLQEIETAKSESRDPRPIPPSVLLVDEINRLQTRFQNFLLSAMNVRKATMDYYLRIPDNNEEITCPAGFLVIVGARNVGGNFIGTNPMDIALERRFFKKIDVSYLGDDGELQLVMNKTSLDQELARVLVKVASDTRYQLSQLRAPLDTDTLLKWAEELAYQMAQGQIATDQTLLGIARDTVFGVVLDRSERGVFDPAGEAILSDNITENYRDIFKI